MKNTIQLENSIRTALEDFKRRLDQQRLFQIQNLLLKAIYQEVIRSKYCQSLVIQNLSLEYEDFYQKLRGSGRSYENIVNEKSLVDTYSAFENFLFDCFYALYKFFPKYLGAEIKIGKKAANSDFSLMINVSFSSKVISPSATASSNLSSLLNI